jgi:hypothetical protein
VIFTLLTFGLTWVVWVPRAAGVRCRLSNSCGPGYQRSPLCLQLRSHLILGPGLGRLAPSASCGPEGVPLCGYPLWLLALEICAKSILFTWVFVRTREVC